MNPNEMDAVEITISIKGKDKNSQVTSIIPLAVAEEISLELIDWENRFFITPVAYNLFVDNKNNFATS